ncbi:MAG TPA: histidinol phosphate phosphatase domain-containing protein [Desulfatiglandales bacterium]|nr:histidinol phosphate phosphatase domain-containing protein [Desulfatiglandales bacterium]
MIDLHTHSLFSDGELIPSELVRRLESLGYRAVAITDHSDASNLDFIIPRIIQVADDLNRSQSVKVIPGVELTHIPPRSIGPFIAKARGLGARLVLVHGESIIEPVATGTNRAAIEGGVDILAHPGLISDEDAALAAEKGVLLEISARAGHSLTNGHVAGMAGKTGAGLVLDSDAHSPDDLMTKEFAGKVAEGAGMPPGSLSSLLSNSRQLLRKIGYPL